MPIRAVIFDLDGLMVDSEPLARQAWRTFLAEQGHPNPSQDDFDAILGLRLMDSSRVIRERFGLALPVEQIAQRRAELFLALLPGNLKPMPGLRELLDAVDARGLRRAVATSSPGFYAPVALREVGVDGFEALVTGDQVAHGKPAPDIFLAAADALGLSPDACLVLEDSPNGVAAAKAAGMRCVAVPNALSADLDLSAADAILPSLTEVAARLEEWVR